MFEPVAADAAATHGIDPYAPAEMAARAASIGVAKARLDTWSLFALAVPAGLVLVVIAWPPRVHTNHNRRPPP